MTDQQEDKLSMYYAVIAAADRHSAIVQGLPAFATHYGEFTAKVDTIRDLLDGQNAGVSGATEAKATARQSMAALAYPVAAAVQAWALANGDSQLADIVGYSQSDFLHSRDTIAEERAQRVHDEAEPRLADLGDYGVDAAMLTNLSNAIAGYHAELVRPQQAIQDRKTVTAGLKTGFASADDVLRNRLDKLVPILAMDHPAFATDWWNSRNIYDSGGGPQIPQTTSEDSPTSSEDISSSEDDPSSESSQDDSSSEEPSSQDTSSEWSSSESSWEESSSWESSSESSWEDSSSEWSSSSMSSESFGVSSSED